MDKQPEALVLARALESGVVHRTIKEAAEELRHLHQVNQELRESVKKANAQAEHFERLWYLRGDVNEELVEALKSVHSICKSDLQYRQFPSSREYEIINICKPLIAKHKEQA